MENCFELEWLKDSPRTPTRFPSVHDIGFGSKDTIWKCVSPVKGAERDLSQERVSHETEVTDLATELSAKWLSSVSEKFVTETMTSLLGHRVFLLSERVRQLEELVTFSVPINTLAPHPYILRNPIQLLVKVCEDEYWVSLVDANLNVTSETLSQALDDLKDLMIDVFERLSELGSARLGPGPLQQFTVLSDLLQRK